MGELVPDDPDSDSAPGAAAPADTPGHVREPDAGPATPDPPPAHGGRDWRKREPRATTPGRPTRVTAAIRNDVQAKVQILLGVPGSVWQARDPLCGGTFMEGLPQTSAAFTAWICQSPDLLNWFTGPGGNFMLVLDIFAALMPTATVVMAHHVYHSVELEAQEPARDYAA